MSKIQQYQHEVHLIKKALGNTDAFIDDNTVFSSLLPSKNIDKKIKDNLKKLESYYNVRILFGDKVADVAEKMYNYRPF